MTNERFNQLQKDETVKQIMKFIPNNLGINLCSVEDIEVKKENGEIKDISIKFS